VIGPLYRETNPYVLGKLAQILLSIRKRNLISFWTLLGLELRRGD